MIHPDERELEQALIEMLEQSPEALRATGRRGLDLVSRRYTWQAIGTMMAEVYEWMLGGRVPTGVEIDLGSTGKALGTCSAQVAPDGKLTWNVPKDFAEKEVDVIVSVSDASGQESFHSFKLGIVDKAE